MASSSLCPTMPADEDAGMRDACGVFACVAAGESPTQLDVAHVICLGLVGLQHRGQESSGIITSSGRSGDKFYKHKGMGLVSAVFGEEQLSKLQGDLGIGHTRYSTAAGSELINCQPFDVDTIHGRIAVAHNGELINAVPLRQQVLNHGVGLSTASDSELITQLLALSPPEGEPDGPDWPARIRNLMLETPTAYSLVIMHDDKVYAVRDPYGCRPLCIGCLLTPGGSSEKNGGGEPEVEGWVVSSESCSFQSIGAKYHREVVPGEIVEVSRHGVKSVCTIPRPSLGPAAFCIFEYVYFARPDTILEGQMVYTVRHRCGRQLALEAPCDADVVSTVPESATPAALGYAAQSGIPYMEVLCKNRYVGRTFIQPNTRLRQLGVAKKFGALTDNLRGKRVILIDDSIVRGNTIGPIIKLLKDAGAKEVHIRVASPPIKHPCYMGINIPTHKELIANRLSANELADYFGANSIVYLTVDGLVTAVQEGIQESKGMGHCTACLTGNYPVDLEW